MNVVLVESYIPRGRYQEIPKDASTQKRDNKHFDVTAVTINKMVDQEKRKVKQQQLTIDG